MRTRPAPLTLRKLQRQIEKIYRLETCPDVDRFLVSTRQAQELVPKDKNLRPQVLLQENDGEVSLAVHFGDQALERIENKGVLNCDLSDFCLVTEEISHFVYLAWSASHERPVSLLDVELQGEIDKFVLANLYFPQEETLFGRMFDEITYDPNLESDDQERYRLANWFGGKFCRSLGEVMMQGLPRPEILAQLRDFYRKTTQERISLVEIM